MQGFNIHHKDYNKTNYSLSNLEKLSISEHATVHSKDIKQQFKPKFSLEEVQHAKNKGIDRCEYANILNIFTDEYYKHLNYYKLTKSTR